MLSLRITSGDYITIGDNIVVQVSKGSGSGFNVSIDAPKDIPIARGSVHEKISKRPDCIQERWKRYPPKQAAKRITR